VLPRCLLLFFFIFPLNFAVCADEYCPYQHIKKEALVQRELLPLPPLRLFPHVLPPTNESQRAEAGLKQREDDHDAEKAVGENAEQQPMEPQTSMQEKELEEHPIDRTHEALRSSVDVDDNSAMAEPYGERDDKVAAMHSEVISVDQQDEVDEPATPTGDEIDEFMLDFVALPPAEDVRSDEDSAEDAVESDEDTDIVSTFLDDTVQSKVTASKLWWSQTVANDQASSPGPTSVEAWLDEVAGFRVRVPDSMTNLYPFQELERSAKILEYRHSLPHSPLDYIQWFGRLVDASRLAVHAGRFDVGQSLLKLATDRANATARFVHGKEVPWGAFLEDQGIEFSPNAGLAVLGRVMEFAFHFDDQPLSCFHTAFSSQISLAIISEAIRYTHDHYDKMGVPQDNGTLEQMDSTELIEWGAVMQLIEACLGSADKVESLAIDFDAKKYGVSNLVSELRNELYRTSDVELTGVVVPEKRGHHQSKHPFSFDTLVANVVWALRICGDRDGASTSFSMHRIDDGILKPSWSIVKNFFRRSIGSSGRSAECLRATIMMGYIILGSLEAFVRHVPYGGDQFDSNTSAALNIVDTTIHKVLVEWSDLVADVPMLEMLLSPLFAACISTAVFLRHYSKAQHRLESLLGEARESKHGTPKTKLVSFSKLSELLWSQLVQLRFSLSSSPDAPAAKKKRKETWDMKPSQIQDCKQLASCMERRHVALHHVCLEGDWNLITAMNHRPLLCTDQDLQHVQGWRSSIARLQQVIFRQTKDKELDLAHCPFVHRQDKANGRSAALDPLRSTLPRSILLAGHSLTSLNLEGCSLSRLPIAFGLYFPALSVRSPLGECRSLLFIFAILVPNRHCFDLYHRNSICPAIVYKSYHIACEKCCVCKNCCWNATNSKICLRFFMS
jgi:hypothetical protein